MSITQEHNEIIVRYNLPGNWNCETSFSFAHLPDAFLRLHVFAHTATVKAVNRFNTVGNYVIQSYLSGQKNAVLLKWVVNIKRQVEQHSAIFFFKHWDTWGSDDVNSNWQGV